MRHLDDVFSLNNKISANCNSKIDVLAALWRPIAMIVYAMTGDSEKFFEFSMNDYIAKRVHVEELRRHLGV